MTESTPQLMIDGILLLIVLILWLKGRWEEERLSDAWDTIAELRLHLDVFFTNQKQIEHIILDEIGIELGSSLVGYGAKEYYISKFKHPHPDAEGGLI